tara:strand:- start:9214 stop:10074 length:861 start_codon:yes stop_codon:yes gene_type:complete
MTDSSSYLSLIVVAYNSDFYLNRLLDSIEENNDLIGLQLVIVDNSDRTVFYNSFDDYSFRIDYYPMNENVGFGMANNLGVEKSIYSNVCLINLDAYITVPLSFVTRSILKHPRCLLGGDMYDEFMNRKKAYGRFPDSLDILFFPSRTYRVNNISFCKEFAVDWIEASLLAFTKETWVELGGFSQEIFMYGEDLLLCSNARKLNISRLIDSTIKYVHTGGYDDSKLGNVLKGFQYYLHDNRGFNFFLLRLAFNSSIYIKFFIFFILSFFMGSYEVKYKSITRNFFYK